MANPAVATPVQQSQTAAVEHEAPGGEAVAFGFIDPGMFIALAMIAVIALIVWKKVPAAIGKALDGKIDAIRNQLAEAETLRKDAEGLKAEYQAKAEEAAGEASAMIERARHEADAMLAKAKVDAEALVERRSRMAEEKIAAEERAAIDKLRATAAYAARNAAAALIADGMDAKTDKTLVDRAIGGLGR
jgi:F-type H+-transporting ATPase subunit b